MGCFVQRVGWNMGGFRAEASGRNAMLKEVAVVPGRLSLAQPKYICQTKPDRDRRDANRNGQGGLERHEKDEEENDGRDDAANEPPEKAPLQAPGPSFGIGRGVGVSEAKGSFHGGSWRV